MKTRDDPADLGRLVSAHATAPRHIQRAAIVAGISFVFFLAMIAAFFVRQHFGYFLLASAFLIVQLFTLTGWWLLKGKILKLREHGMVFGNFSGRWNEITGVSELEAGRNGHGLRVSATENRAVVIPPTIDGLDRAAHFIRSQLGPDTSDRRS